MKLRKLNRAIHRDFGYFFFGMAVIYGVSGIVLNHRSGQGDASIIRKSMSFSIESPVLKDSIDKVFIDGLLKRLGEEGYKQYYFPGDQELMVYLKGGHISLDLETGEGTMVKVRNRPVFREFNFLHYNKPKKLWTWFSDLFAGSLVLMALTGLFILKGKNGILYRGMLFSLAGIIIPLIFLIIYLWAG